MICVPESITKNFNDEGPASQQTSQVCKWPCRLEGAVNTKRTISADTLEMVHENENATALVATGRH